jgi:hypothetical protein
MTQTVDGTRSIRIAELKRHKLLQQGKPRPWLWRKEGGGKLSRVVVLQYGRTRDGELELIFDYQGAFRRQRVAIVTTACNYGGLRPWFRCLCGRRVGVLFDGLGAFVCRRCLDLGYACQQQAPRWRPMLRAQSIRRRLGGSGSLMDDFPEWPRYMHWKTYEKLRRKSIVAEQRALSVIGGGLSRNLSRLRFLAANVR